MPFNCIAFLYKLNVPFLNISLIFLCRGRHLSPQVDSLLLPLYCSLPTAARISILNVTMKMSLSKHANEALLQFKVQSRLILLDFHALTQTSPHHVSCFSFHLDKAGLLAAPWPWRSCVPSQMWALRIPQLPSHVREAFPVQSQNIYPCHWVSSHTVLFVIMTRITPWHYILYYSVICLLSVTTLKKNELSVHVESFSFSHNTLVTFGIYYIFN